MGFTATGAGNALRTLFGQMGTGTAYIALFLNDGTEVSGSGYARCPIGLSTTTGHINMEVTDGGLLRNNAIIFFDEPLADWTTSSNKITAFKICNSLTGTTDDDYLYTGQVKDATTSTVGVEVTTGHIFFIRAGQFTISIDGNTSINAG